MNVIRHNAIFVHNHIFVMLRNLQNTLFRNSACIG